MKVRIPLFLLLGFSLSFPLFPSAQQDRPYTLRVEVELVNLDSAVVDARGRFVAGLTQKNFQVFEDGQPQEVTHFASLEAPLQVALLIETSPAVYLIREEHLAAVFTLLDHLRAGDALAVACYDQQWQPVVGFTQERARLREHLRALNYSLGMAELNLFDALVRTLEWLAPEPSPQPGRRAILLIGTGLDTRSETSADALKQKLAASGVTLFAVATGSLLREPADEAAKKKQREDTRAGRYGVSNFERAFAEADARLKHWAEETGGRAYFPRTGAELRTAYREIGERLRHTYSLGYVSSNRARDGSYRAIELRLVGEDGQPLPHRVLARRGYYAPQD